MYRFNWQRKEIDHEYCWCLFCLFVFIFGKKADSQICASFFSVLLRCTRLCSLRSSGFQVRFVVEENRLLTKKRKMYSPRTFGSFDDSKPRRRWVCLTIETSSVSNLVLVFLINDTHDERKLRDEDNNSQKAGLWCTPFLLVTNEVGMWSFLINNQAMIKTALEAFDSYQSITDRKQDGWKRKFGEFSARSARVCCVSGVCCSKSKKRITSYFGGLFKTLPTKALRKQG